MTSTCLLLLRTGCFPPPWSLVPFPSFHPFPPPTPPSSPLSRHGLHISPHAQQQNWNPPPNSLCLPTASCSHREISQLQGSLEMGCHVHGRVSNTNGSPKIRCNFPPDRRSPSKSRGGDLDEAEREGGGAAWSSEPPAYRPDACRASLRKEKQ